MLSEDFKKNKIELYKLLHVVCERKNIGPSIIKHIQHCTNNPRLWNILSFPCNNKHSRQYEISRLFFYLNNCIALLRKNKNITFQYWIYDSEKTHFNANGSDRLHDYILDYFSVQMPSTIEIYFPIEITNFITHCSNTPFQSAKKLEERFTEDNYEALIRNNLKAFLKYNNIDKLQKATDLHVINFLKSKFKVEVPQPMSRRIVKYLKDQ